MAKMGRPKKEINQETFEKLCGIMCTLEEIAGVFNCSEDTIERWCKETYDTTFAEISKRFQGTGKSSLRRMQFKLAERSAAMAIWLGKQYLGQRDTIEVENKEALDRLDNILEGLKGNAGTEHETE
jgi:AraC-like DNA-binding protein